MNKISWFLCVVIVIALVIPYCDGRRSKRRGEEVTAPAMPIGKHSKAGEHKEDWKNSKDGHWKGHEDGHRKGHKDGHGKGHHWGMKEWQKYANLTMYFVEDSLPVSVYIVLADKGLEVRAAYEVYGNTTTITKVGVRIGDKSLIVSMNGTITIDGSQSSLWEFKPVEVENGSITKDRRGKLTLTYGPYQIFVKVHPSFESKGRTSTYVPHVGLRVGVHKLAKVQPSGFIGARIAIDATQCIFYLLFFFLSSFFFSSFEI